MKNLKLSEAKKLNKALALIEKANTLILEVNATSEAFRYGSNTNSLLHRVDGAIDILKTDLI